MKRVSFCDNWRYAMQGEEQKSVIIPHDAMQERGRSADASSSNNEGYYLGGTYIYEKKWRVPEDVKEKRYYLEFEGVYPVAAVYLDGEESANCKYGYSSMTVSLDGLRAGEESVIRVVVDDEEHPRSRWYGGAGIYRPVWLISVPKEHIVPKKTRITTVSVQNPEILVETEISAEADATVEIEILDGETVIARASKTKASILLPAAKLWSAENPALYQCHVLLKRGKEILDEEFTEFGVRQIKWSTEGFFVNGNSVKLKGGCIHHDHGILGARTFDESEYRRIERMKSFGFNAVRSAHNPLSRAAIEACDRLGIYVMDELWDTWTNTKTPNDFGKDFLEHYESDITKMIEKDYNHPAVVIYSIGNEVTEPAKPEGVELGKHIASLVKEQDPTRPITAGLNLTLLLMAHKQEEGNTKSKEEAKSQKETVDSTAFNEQVMMMGKRMTMASALPEADEISTPILNALDICGYNYGSSRYEKEGELHPERIVVGSETFPQDLPDNWKMVEKYPYLIGDFMWTAWDYIGEVGLGSWVYEKIPSAEKPYPWLLSDCGVFDILGNDTAEAGMASVIWGARNIPYIGVKPVNHLGITPIVAMWRGTNALPYWSYSGCEGNEAEVEVYTKEAKVELLINGRSVGTEEVKDHKVIFHTAYEPGELLAIAYDESGTEQSRHALYSAEGETQVRIQPETAAIAGRPLYVNIDLVGENGEIECNADRTLEIRVEGGTLLAFGSANPKTEESFQSGRYTTYYGRAQAVVIPEYGNLVIQVSDTNDPSKKRRYPLI